MKIKTLHIVTALLSPFVLSVGLAAQSSAGTGAKFGTRDPRDCTLTVDSPSGAQLQQIFICEAEAYAPSNSFGDRLFLVSRVNLQFSNPHAFVGSPVAYQNMDTTQPVYDARGSYVWWNCFVPSGDASGNQPRPGHSCFKYLAPAVQGIAFRDTFGEWHVKVCCAAHDSGQNGVELFPPPTDEY